MRIEKGKLMTGILLAMTLSIISIASAQTLPYYYGGTVNFSESCTTGQDFVLQVPPGACQPAVVRSDLLAEQDVPVYCNIIGIKINPLIDVPYIRSITPLGFTATKDISGIHFYPAKASVATTPGMAPVGTPSSINNLGWLIVQLKQKPVEKDIPDKIELNLTAKIKYELQNSFGIAENEMTLTEMTEDSWKNVAQRYSFWRGKGYVRAMKVDENSASFAVYDGTQRNYQTVTVKKGETSLPVYLTGFYCSAGVKIDLKDINFPSTKAIIVVNGVERIVSERMPIYEGSKCIVSTITSGISPYIKISCPDGTYPLSLVPRDASLIVDKEAKKVKQGELIKNNIYLLYAGNEDSKNYIVVFKTNKPTEVTDKVLDVRTKITNLHAEGKKVLENSVDFTDYTIITQAQAGSANGVSISIASDFVALGTTIHEANVEDNFKKAVAAAEDTKSKYTYVKKEGGDSYGLVALREAADLAASLNKKEEQFKLLNEIVDTYKDENIAKERKELDLLVSSESSSVSFLDKSTGQSFFVVLKTIDLPAKSDNFATVVIGGVQKDIGVGESINEAWYVGKITDSCMDAIGVTEGKQSTVSICKDATMPLQVGTGEKATSTSVKVIGTKVNKEAYVRLIPFSKEGETIANFTVQIGVEKRAIQLTPDQMNEHIKKVSELSATIEDWNSKLRPLIQNWKLACFATQATLAVKNLIFTPQGEARKAAMHGMTINGKQNGGWTEFCSGKIGDPSIAGKFKTLDACYKHYANDINKDVSNMKKAMEDTNTDVERIKKANTDANGKLVEDAYIKDALTGSGNSQLAAIAKSDYFAKLRENGDITKEDVKELIFLQKMQANCAGSTSPLCTGEEKETAVKNFNAILKATIEGENGKLQIIENGEKSTQNAAGSGAFWATAGDYVPENVAKINAGVYSKVEFDKKFATEIATESGFKAISDKLENPNYRVAGIKGTGAFLVIAEKRGDVYAPISAYDKTTGAEITDAAALTKLSLNSIRINGIDVSSAVYPFSEISPQVRFWEDGKYKGFAAIVPFEYKSAGYYVKMNKADYEQNGQPLALNIYNVGSDGKIEDGGNDISIQSLNVAQLTADNEIANTALKAVRAANVGYGGKTVSILGRSYVVGQAAVNIPGYQCYDFMSHSDCSVLFNVCDPVLCPPSRCNLGGTYNTANVVQSGIIGSMVLCSKNSVAFGGDVVVPICLTGLNAGLENLNSVLKSYRDCMNESLTTGKTVGICDEIYSVYICELVWREALPFVTQGIPSIVTAMLHQGGGEYASFQSNWNNFVGTVGYFTSQYAETAFEAFKVRSTVQVGTEACKLFFSLRYPDLIDLVDRLTKAESPPQFFAYFDEISFTTVTYPSTSQYKIYYHIYAGEDKGINYNIYLSSPAYSSGTFISPVQLIDTGFLAQGQYKDATKDLLAPAGYKELCIEIDGQRNCGFGKVGTEFTINYLSDKYVQSQLTQEINSKDECISGTPSLLPLIPGVSANIEEGLVQAANPSLQKTGVTRICSADNPGKGTSEARWNFVGWCDKDAKLACWVDTTTVKQAIKDLGILNQTLSYSQSVVADYLDAKGYLTQQESSTELGKLKSSLKTLTKKDDVPKILDIAKSYSDIEDKSFFLDEKAQASLGIAESYIKKVKIEAGTETAIAPPGGGGGAGGAAQPTTSKTVANKGEAVFYPAQQMSTDELVSMFYPESTSSAKQSYINKIQAANSWPAAKNSVSANEAVKIKFTKGTGYDEESDFINYIKSKNPGGVLGCNGLPEKNCNSQIFDAAQQSSGGYIVRKGCFFQPKPLLGISYFNIGGGDCRQCATAEKCEDFSYPYGCSETLCTIQKNLNCKADFGTHTCVSVNTQEIYDNVKKQYNTFLDSGNIKSAVGVMRDFILSNLKSTEAADAATTLYNEADFLVSKDKASDAIIIYKALSDLGALDFEIINKAKTKYESYLASENRFNTFVAQFEACAKSTKPKCFCNIPQMQSQGFAEYEKTEFSNSGGKLKIRSLDLEGHEIIAKQENTKFCYFNKKLDSGDYQGSANPNDYITSIMSYSGNEKIVINYYDNLFKFGTDICIAQPGFIPAGYFEYC